MRVIPPTWGIVPVISKLDEKQANWPKVGARSAIGEQLAAAALNQVPRRQGNAHVRGPAAHGCAQVPPDNA
jgi:hypothetical protein